MQEHRAEDSECKCRNPGAEYLECIWMDDVAIVLTNTGRGFGILCIYISRAMPPY